MLAEDLTFQEEAPVPPVLKLERSITALVSVTALPLPSLYVNVTVLLVASYLYTLVPPDAVPPLFSVEPVGTVVGAI